MNEFSLDHPLRQIRQVALRDYIASDAPDKIQVLQKRLDKETIIWLKYEIQYALDHLLQESAPAEVPPGQHREILRNLHSLNLNTIQKTLAYLEKYRLTDYLEYTLELEHKFPNSLTIKLYNIRLLYHSGNAASRVLGSYLKDKDPVIAGMALQALFELGSTRSYHLVFKSIQHPMAAIRNKAESLIDRLPRAVTEYILKQMIEGFYPNAEQISSQIIETLEHRSAENRVAADSYGPPDIHSPGITDACEKDIQSHALRTDSGPEDPLFDNKVFQSLSDKDRRIVKEPLSHLVNLLRTSQDPKVLAMAIFALSSCPGEDDVKRKIIREFCEHPNARVRANAVESLMQITPPGYRAEFRKYLKDNNNRVVSNAILALRDHPDYENLFHGEVRNKLHTMAEGEINFKLSAIYCIGYLQSEDLLELLDNLASDCDEIIARRATEVMSHWSINNPIVEKRFRSLTRLPIGLDQSLNSGGAPSQQDSARSQTVSSNDSDALIVLKASDESITSESRSVETRDTGVQTVGNSISEDSLNEVVEVSIELSDAMGLSGLKSEPDSRFLGLLDLRLGMRETHFLPRGITGIEIAFSHGVAVLGGIFSGLAYGLVALSISESPLSSIVIPVLAAGLGGLPTGRSVLWACRSYSEKSHSYRSYLSSLASVFLILGAWAPYVFYHGGGTEAVFHPVSFLKTILGYLGNSYWAGQLGPLSSLLLAGFEVAILFFSAYFTSQLHLRMKRTLL